MRTAIDIHHCERYRRPPHLVAAVLLVNKCLEIAFDMVAQLLTAQKLGVPIHGFNMPAVLLQPADVRFIVPNSMRQLP
jgi:hypothetical protein